MALTRTIDIDAPADRVWAVMTDVERWPDWTASVSTIQRLDHGPFTVGSRVRIKQPRLPPSVLTVTELEPGRGFTWVATSPGLRVTAAHGIEPAPRGVRVTLSVRYEGVFGRLAGRLWRSLTERYLRLEADGLKRRSEQSQSAPAPASSART